MKTSRSLEDDDDHFFSRFSSRIRGYVKRCEKNVVPGMDVAFVSMFSRYVHCDANSMAVGLHDRELRKNSMMFWV